MPFLAGFNPLTGIGKLMKMVFWTTINVLLINYASSRALEEGDTDWLTAIILLASLAGSVSLLIDSLGSVRKSFRWDYLLYLLTIGFNVYYLFKVMMCCIPLAGDLL